MIPTLIGISVVTFLLVHLAPGSPVSTGYGTTVSGGDVEDEAKLCSSTSRSTTSRAPWTSS
jgi:ABC-type dipeptide/oligopeptide/nickel transport system permease component